MEGKSAKPIAVLGAGSWGTALALYLARRGQVVRLWSVQAAEVNAMLAGHTNSRYLPGFPFPDQIQPTADLAEAIQNTSDILIAVPSVGFRATLTQLKPLLSSSHRIICASKGLEEESGKLLNEMAEEILGKNYPFAALSGPSFAREVAAGLPTAVMIASKDSQYVKELIEHFNSPIFRTFPSDDVKGVEIGSVVKNVIAIATGISDGMEYGTNARCALITQGLEEIIKLGTSLGARMETIIGLAGMGDLILTCTDNQSRNRRFGLALGKGQNVQEAETQIGQVVEGKRNAELVALLAKKHRVNMPVCNMVWQVVQGKQSAREAMDALLASHTSTDPAA